MQPVVLPGPQPLVGAHEVVVQATVSGGGSGQSIVGISQFEVKSDGAQPSQVSWVGSTPKSPPPDTFADSSTESRRTVVLFILIAICFSVRCSVGQLNRDPATKRP